MILAAVDYQPPHVEVVAPAPSLPEISWSCGCSGDAGRGLAAARLAGDQPAATGQPSVAEQPAGTGTGETPPPAPAAAPVATPAEPAHDQSPELDQSNAAVDEHPIVVTARPKNDPAMEINIVSYKAVQAVDLALIRPVSMAYKAALPSPARQGVHNVLTNLTEPVVFLNFLLQGKFGKALVVVGRFAINSTVGIGGLMDVAAKKPFRLPYRKNNFADTLGFYGIGPGPYMFVPLVGPTTVRDLFGLLVDKAVVPFSFGGPFKTRYYAIGNGVLSSLDYRVRYDDMITQQQRSEDPYAAARREYLQGRAAEIAALHTGKNRHDPATPATEGQSVAQPVAGPAAQPQAETAPAPQTAPVPAIVPPAEPAPSPAPPAPVPGPVSQPQPETVPGML